MKSILGRFDQVGNDCVGGSRIVYSVFSRVNVQPYWQDLTFSIYMKRKILPVINPIFYFLRPALLPMNRLRIVHLIIMQQVDLKSRFIQVRPLLELLL